MFTVFTFPKVSGAASGVSAPVVLSRCLFKEVIDQRHLVAPSLMKKASASSNICVFFLFLFNWSTTHEIDYSTFWIWPLPSTSLWFLPFKLFDIIFFPEWQPNSLYSFTILLILFERRHLQKISLFPWGLKFLINPVILLFMIAPCGFWFWVSIVGFDWFKFCVLCKGILILYVV